MIGLEELKTISFTEPVIIDVNHGNISQLSLAGKIDYTVSIPRYRFKSSESIYCPLLKKLMTITYICDGENND